MSTDSQPFTILDVPTDAFCDPDTGVCSVPLPAMPPPAGEADPSEHGEGSRDGREPV